MRKRIQRISKYAPSIFQGRLELSTHVRGAAFAIEHPFERNAFRILLVLLALAAALYIYFVGASILNVIARKEAMRTTANLASSVAELEKQYFALAKGITPEEGQRLGLSAVSETSYVRTPGGVAATIER